MIRQQNRLLSLFCAVIVFGVLLVAYARTLIPGTVGGDAGELQYAAPLLALVHPTGQPLYVLLGFVWTSALSLGTAAYEMNLLAAVSGAIGGGLVAWFVGRVYNAPLTGLIAGVVLGFGATVWGESVLADKYGFNVLLSALIVGLALWWDRDHDKPHGNRLLYGLSLAFAVGLLHHRSLALFAPGIGIMVIAHFRAELWRNWKRTLICAGLVLLPPLLIYPTVLPALQARENAPLLIQPQRFSDWVDYILERHVIAGEALVFDAGITEQLEIYAETLINDYTPLVPIIALFGLGALFRRYPVSATFLLVSYLLEAVLSANFRGNVRQFTYYLPSFVVLMFAFAYGLRALWHIMRNTAYEVASRQLAIRYAPMVFASLALALMAIIPALQFADTYPDARERAIYGDPLDLWRQTLKSGNMGARLTASLDRLPENTALASDWEQVTILWYQQQVEGMREDIAVFYPIERYSDYAGERPVCLARHVPVSTEWHPTNVGAFICLNNAPQTTLPDDMTALDVDLQTPDGENVITLAGFDTPIPTEGIPQIAPGTYVPITLYWQAMTDIDADYSISLQLLDENWNFVWSQDIQSPVMGTYATSRWVEGEVVGDYHELALPRTLAPGRYRWTVVVYQYDVGGNFLQLRDVNGNVNIEGGVFDLTAR